MGIGPSRAQHGTARAGRDAARAQAENSAPGSKQARGLHHPGGVAYRLSSSPRRCARRIASARLRAPIFR